MLEAATDLSEMQKCTKEILTSRRWSQVFQGHVETPHFIKGAQSVFLWRFYHVTPARRGNIEIVWIGKFSLLLKRSRDAWMDMLPLPTMSEERRQNQYLADVIQDNVERQGRNVDVLDPNLPETRDHWYATQVSNHERLVPFSDNLTTLMFIVISDLSGDQGERDSQVPFLCRE